jgi:prevent-host-death family protein
MKQVGVSDAKTHFPRQLEEVEKGETITITRHGKPVAKLVPIEAQRRPVAETIEAIREARKGRTLGWHLPKWTHQRRPAILVAFVLDSSMTLAWLFSDAESAYADTVLGRLHKESAAVQANWPLEVANGLWAGERRGRIIPT